MILMVAAMLVQAPDTTAEAPSSTSPSVVYPRKLYVPPAAQYYPAESLERNEQGVTRLRCQLTAEGALAQCRVDVSSGHTALDEAALKLAPFAIYSPMMVDGRATASWVALPIVWQMAD